MVKTTVILGVVAVGFGLLWHNVLEYDRRLSADDNVLRIPARDHEWPLQLRTNYSSRGGSHSVHHVAAVLRLDGELADRGLDVRCASGEPSQGTFAEDIRFELATKIQAAGLAGRSGTITYDVRFSYETRPLPVGVFKPATDSLTHQVRVRFYDPATRPSRWWIRPVWILSAILTVVSGLLCVLVIAGSLLGPDAEPPVGPPAGAPSPAVPPEPCEKDSS